VEKNDVVKVSTKGNGIGIGFGKVNGSYKYGRTDFSVNTNYKEVLDTKRKNSKN